MVSKDGKVGGGVAGEGGWVLNPNLREGNTKICTCYVQTLPSEVGEDEEEEEEEKRRDSGIGGPVCMFTDLRLAETGSTINDLVRPPPLVTMPGRGG